MVEIRFRSVDFNDCDQGTVLVREGCYKFGYQGAAGFGVAELVPDISMVDGTKAAGGHCDGEYVWDNRNQRLDVTVSVWVPERTPLVRGIIAPSGGHTLEARCSFPPDPNNHVLSVDTDLRLAVDRIHPLRSFSQ